jgi:hypothetical protein
MPVPSGKKSGNVTKRQNAKMLDHALTASVSLDGVYAALRNFM